MKKIFLFIFISLYLAAISWGAPYTSQTPKSTTSVLRPPTGTVAGMNASPTQGDLYRVTDGASASDCTTGGGSNDVLCTYDGSAWVSTGGGGPITVITCTDGDVLGTDCGSGTNWPDGFIVEIASGTVTLMAVETGAIGCVKATSAAAIHVDPNANDRFVLDGTGLDDGDKLTSNSQDDDTICFYADSAAGWTTIQNPNGFTDGG